MILGQIGEGRHVIVDAPHPFQGQGVAGNLHYHMGAARVPHPGKESLQIQAFRGGALCGDDFLPNHIGHGANQADLGSLNLLQHLLEKQGGRSLAVGARNAHHSHLPGRISIEVAGKQSQSQPVGLHQNIGNLPLRLFRCDHGGSAPLQCHGDEPVAVGGKAGHRHKQASGLRLPGIIADGGDFVFLVRGAFQNGNILE